MIIHRSGRPTLRAASQYFTGTVWQDPIVEAPAPANLRALRVSFEPGARTAADLERPNAAVRPTDGVPLAGVNATVLRLAPEDLGVAWVALPDTEPLGLRVIVPTAERLCDGLPLLLMVSETVAVPERVAEGEPMGV